MTENLVSEEQKIRIERDYASMRQRLGQLPPLPEDATRDERVCLQYLYAYMPVSDAAACPAIFFVEWVRETLRIRAKIPWGDMARGELFLHYVLPCRINNEDLTAHRTGFFLELFPRVRGHGLLDAALEVNYWCFEKATYRSTNTRTLSPLGVVRNAFGRCGEESVLLTAALRSVGIPARQCYSPRWAHCDDNHAWVEFWDGQRWRFTGACEPEPLPDKGWFTPSARRAMLIHTRVFSSFVSREEVTEQSPVLSTLNILRGYAPTRTLRLLVREAGAPVEGARVYFQLINFAELFSISTQRTDAQGRAHLETGLGDLLIHISRREEWMEQKVDVRRLRDGDEVVFAWENAVREAPAFQELALIPPVVNQGQEPMADALAQSAHEARCADCIRIRGAYEESFLRGERARTFAGEFPDFAEKIALLLEAANGNHPEIARFLRGEGLLALRVRLLESLQRKDLTDCRAEELEDSLWAAAPYGGQFPEAIFDSFLLCPRVHLEKLVPHRADLLSRLADGEAEGFRLDPGRVMDYVRERVKLADCLDYATISAPPGGLLDLGVGSALSLNILFVALCRTCGVPARLSPIDFAPEYWRGTWIPVARRERADRTCRLTLRASDARTKLEYRGNFSVARLAGGVFTTLGLEGEAPPGEEAVYALAPGAYRVTVAGRTPDGTVLATLYGLGLEAGQTKELTIAPRAGQAAQAVPLPDLHATSAAGNAVPLFDYGNGKNWMMAWIMPGTEPTEHLFNEMLEQEAAFCRLEGRLLFLLADGTSEQNATLAAVRARIPVETAYARRDALHSLAKVFPEGGADGSDIRLPLVMAVDENACCIYHCVGYNVGTGKLLLDHLEKGNIVKL